MTSVSYYTRAALKRHKCQTTEDCFSCPECGMLGISVNEIKEHVDNEHKDQRDQSREVCKHFKCGNCFRGNNCKFAHVGYRQESVTTDQSLRSTNCHNGEACRWLARGICRFNYQVT